MEPESENPEDLFWPMCRLITMHAIAAVALGLFLLFVVPKFTAIFASFGMDLPAPTRFLLSASALARSHMFVVPTAVLVFLFHDAAVYYLLLRFAERRWQVAWRFYMAIALVVLLFGIVLGLFLPLVALMTAVGRGSSG